MEYGIEAFAQKILDNVEALIDFAEEHKITDEQWYIDWEMKLSELCTKDHNK